MLNKTKYFLSSASMLALPMLAMARTNDITDVISLITRWINLLIPLIIGLGVLYFLWGLVSYITSGSDETKKIEARGMIIYGIVFLFVMVSVWGLVNILVGSADLDTAIPTDLPTVPKR